MESDSNATSPQELNAQAATTSSSTINQPDIFDEVIAAPENRADAPLPAVAIPDVPVLGLPIAAADVPAVHVPVPEAAAPVIAVAEDLVQ